MTTKLRVELQPAYVLHQKPFQNSSAIVDLITPEYGRVSVVARGIKRPKSKYLGQVRSFQPMLLSWMGRGELKTLTHVEIQGKALHLPANMLATGFYLNELLIRLIHPMEPQVEIFSHYDEILRYFSNIDLLDDEWPWGLQCQLRQFEMTLLAALGYGVGFETEVSSGDKVRENQIYCYQVDCGPVFFDESAPIDASMIRVNGSTLTALANDTMGRHTGDTGLFREAKQLMRTILQRYLGDRPLQSRKLFSPKK